VDRALDMPSAKQTYDWLVGKFCSVITVLGIALFVVPGYPRDPQYNLAQLELGRIVPNALRINVNSDLHCNIFSSMASRLSIVFFPNLFRCVMLQWYR
jgi:hypothetical protein